MRTRRAAPARPERRAARLAAALALAAAACPGPRIERFEERTQVLCPGEDGAIDLRAAGDVTLAIRIDDPRLAPGPGATPDARAPDTVTVTLVAGDTSRKASFLKVAGRWDETVAFQASREGDALVARGDKNPSWWGGPRFAVSRVAAVGRALEVRHAGRAATVAPEGSEAFAETPLAGAWELRAPLTDDEKAGRAPVPGSLRVVATVTCKEARK